MKKSLVHMIFQVLSREACSDEWFSPVQLDHFLTLPARYTIILDIVVCNLISTATESDFMLPFVTMSTLWWNGRSRADLVAKVYFSAWKTYSSIIHTGKHISITVQTAAFPAPFLESLTLADA